MPDGFQVATGTVANIRIITFFSFALHLHYFDQVTSVSQMHPLQTLNLVSFDNCMPPSNNHQKRTWNASQPLKTPFAGGTVLITVKSQQSVSCLFPLCGGLDS